MLTSLHEIHLMIVQSADSVHAFSPSHLPLPLWKCESFHCLSIPFLWVQILAGPNITNKIHVSYIEYLFEKIKYDNQIKRLNLGPGSDEC